MLYLVAALLALVVFLQLRNFVLMSALSDKIAALQSTVATLSTDVETALGNAATPADLEALDQVNTDLQAVIARLTPPA